MSFDFRELSDRLEKRSSRRLGFRELAYCDAWPLFQATRTPRFNEHLTWAMPQHEREAEARVEAIRGAARRNQLMALSVVVRDTGEWVSLFRFQPSGHGPKSIEVGVWTHPNFWHGRYSPELMTHCIDGAFECSDASEVVGAGAVENRGSLGLMRVAGMKPSRSFSKPTETGEMLPAIEYRIGRDEWLDRRQKRTERSRASEVDEQLAELA